MGRRQRSLDPGAGPVAEFALRLRALRERAGDPTFATMSRRVHRSTTVLSEAAGGVDLPTWATVEAFLEACGETDPAPWRDHWERARDALGEPATSEDGSVPARPADAGPPRPPALRPVSSATPRWWTSRPATAAAALVVGLTAGLLTGLRLPRDTASAEAGPQPTPSRALPTVVVVPPPAPLPWPAAGSGCDARTHWVYQYDHSYQGQVYALLARPDGKPADTPVTLTWGAWRWQHPVTVQPGTPAQTTGGTLLLYTKLDTSLRDPLVTVDTADPVCAAFGTAGPTSVAPLTTVDANQGWTGAEPTAETPDAG
ncbi:helix-turn-helix protein [Streptomyces sp. 1114.5]|uniref:helix-turn-helix domain-containing protein n=1 Tax=unclassified Streptomyces TaxID=2593676 RepID=UPI000BD93971|nr:MULTISPECIES: helix-turn-helix transcriptional regulator [unclassified Streptomyces]RKT19320.1 helix-turn-helix protein [Streptomyces sp. 1114.5]SOB85517.1 Helix-turn-helix domain-containing protein [Streptomyces sp. 1331.2]